jgi:hypothetical protein
LEKIEALFKLPGTSLRIGRRDSAMTGALYATGPGSKSFAIMADDDISFGIKFCATQFIAVI